MIETLCHVRPLGSTPPGGYPEQVEWSTVKELVINNEERAMPQTPISASDATPEWEGWPEICKTRAAMCEQKAGEKAFLEYLNSMIRPPRKFRPNHARKIVVLLRSLHPYAFPLADILPVIQYVHVKGDEYIKPNVNTLGRWAREGGARVFYATRHLDGTLSAPSATTGNESVNDLATGLSTIGRGLDRIQTVSLDRYRDELEPEMREQLTIIKDDLLARFRFVEEILRVGE